MTNESLINSKCKYCIAQMELGFNRIEDAGSKKSRIILLGEAPGATEDEENRPFVGRSGIMLQTMLRDIGVSREDLYITNICRCRPSKTNRTPRLSEARECRDNCFNETLKEMYPDVIVCLGALSWKAMCNDGQVSLLRDRRKIVYYRGVPVVCTYHPAYVLRNPVSYDWVVADLESYLLDKSYIRHPFNVDYEVVE